MISRTWEPEKHNLENAFFPVALCDLKFACPKERDLFDGSDATEDVPAPEYKAVVDLDRRKMFAAVSDEYRLVTNKEAYQWAEPVIGSVFMHSNLKDFACFNVRMSSSRSNCCIDLIRKPSVDGLSCFYPFKDDPWIAFIRIVNSYNKTACLKYQLGFCRYICLNGVIFESKSVNYVFTHTKSSVGKDGISLKLASAASEQIGEIQTLEERFVKQLQKLREHVIPQSVVLALACKVFNLHLTRAKVLKMTDAEIQMARSFAAKIKRDTKEYYSSFGANAYAAMNVLTDFASYPEGMNGIRTAPFLQARAGAWMEDFSNESEKPNFRMTNYLGADAIEAATWYESLLDPAAS